MKYRKIGICLVLCLAFLLEGCQVGKTSVVFTTGLGSEDVFEIGGTTCRLPEAMVYLCNYQNIYGRAYGVDLWDDVKHKNSLEEYVKDLTITELTRIVCMDELAEQKEIALTEEEMKQIETATDEYYESLTDTELKYMGADKDTIKKLYTDYALAQALYRSLTTGVDVEVSDDEARIMEGIEIFVTDKEKAQKVQADIDSGKDFLTIATNYTQADNIEITFGREDVPDEVEQVAFDLDNDEISKAIETKDGYYFIKCTNKFNEELTDENKTKIVAKREKAAFDDEYSAFVSSQASNINEDLWNTVEIQLDPDITTNTFFSIYDAHVGIE